jgi:hypothetical protein
LDFTGDEGFSWSVESLNMIAHGRSFVERKEEKDGGAQNEGKLKVRIRGS